MWILEGYTTTMQEQGRHNGIALLHLQLLHLLQLSVVVEGMQCLLPSEVATQRAD